MSLNGKIAVVTGGSSGIGRATAALLSDSGARLGILGRSQASLDSAQKALGSDVVAVRGDVSSLEDLDRFFETVSRRLGRIDVLVANAGIAKFAPLTDFPESLFDEIVSVNFKGVFFTVQRALDHLQDGASVILTGSSMASTRGAALNSVYLATKAAVRSLARSFTDELKERRIRVNVVSPGLIDTPILTRDTGRFGKYRDQLAAMYEKASPIGRLGTAEEIARVIRFLADEDSAYVYGAELVADGGMMQL